MKFGYTYFLICIHTSFNLLTHKPKQILVFSLFTQPYYSSHTIAGSAFAVKAESEHSCLLLHLQHKPDCMSVLLPKIARIHPYPVSHL